MASKLPIARPPSELSPGQKMEYVDHRFGFPVAAGNDADGSYVEQLQFVDGVPIGWKVARFSIHGALDALTYCLWEFIGTPIEYANREYPTHVYYVVYDADGKIVKSFSSESEEGKRMSKLPWSVSYVKDLKVNKDNRIRMEYLQKK